MLHKAKSIKGFPTLTQQKLTQNKTNFKVWNDNLTKMYGQYDMTANQPFLPGKEPNQQQTKSLLDLKPGTILTVGIDHKQNKFIHPKGDEKDELKAKMDQILNKKKTNEKKTQKLMTTHEDELLFLVNSFDLSNLTEEQLTILSSFNKIFEELQQSSSAKRLNTNHSDLTEH